MAIGAARKGLGAGRHSGFRTVVNGGGARVRAIVTAAAVVVLVIVGMAVVPASAVAAGSGSGAITAHQKYRTDCDVLYCVVRLDRTATAEQAEGNSDAEDILEAGVCGPIAVGNGLGGAICVAGVKVVAIGLRTHAKIAIGRGECTGFSLYLPGVVDVPRLGPTALRPTPILVERGTFNCV